MNRDEWPSRIVLPCTKSDHAHVCWHAAARRSRGTPQRDTAAIAVVRSKWTGTATIDPGGGRVAQRPRGTSAIRADHTRGAPPHD